MRKRLQSAFQPRQYMMSEDFELFYYEDHTPLTVDLHTHNYYEFYFLLEGDVKMQVGEECYPVRFGDIILIPPHTHHRTFINTELAPYRRFVFWIGEEYCNHLLQSSPDYAYIMQLAATTKQYVFHTDQISFNSVQSKILRLLEEMHSQKFGRDTQISVCVNDLILHLNRLVYDQQSSSKKNYERALYRQLMEYIEEHIEDDLSLEKIAAEFYVSKYHIAHVFKDNTGLSIHQFITKKRLGLCRDAIQSKMNITEAYQMFGFGDYSSFYRAFKKEYGISPKDFRDMQMEL